MNWLDRIDRELEALESSSMRRRLRVVESARAGSVSSGGETLVNLSHNDYLGLSREPEVAEAAARAAREWGAGAGASRSITGNTRLHEELEAALARFKGASSALVFPTGYQASLGAVAALASPDDVVFADRLAHSCLVDGARLSGAKLRVFPHNDAARLGELLDGAAAFRHRWILANGVYSMDGDIAPLPELLALAEKHDATVILDDAHATGVVGDTGRGTAEHFGLDAREYEDRLVIVATLSKALGSQGGAVLCKPVVREWLVNRARTFVYTTGLAPACAAAALAAIGVLEREPQRVLVLRERAAAARARLNGAGLDTMRSETAIVPVRMDTPEKAVGASDALKARGFLALPIRPPTVPRGTSRLRLAVNTTIGDDVFECALDAAISACGTFVREGAAR